MLAPEDRIRTYEPLWGQWKAGRLIYSGERTYIFELERYRGQETLKCAAKMVFIGPSEKQLEQARRELRAMEDLKGCGSVVALLDDALFPVAEAGQVAGYDLILRMELLECLEDLMREEETFSYAEVLRIGEDVASALEFIHGRGYIHRDVKPGNIYRNSAGVWQLGDMGAAREPEDEGSPRTIAGTGPYMAPEVILGSEYDQRADLYSLGMVLYQLSNANRLPFSGRTSDSAQRARAAARRLSGARLPRPENAPAAFCAVIRKACAAKPEQRFSGAGDLKRELSRLHRMKKKGIWAAAAACALCFAAGAAARGAISPAAGRRPAGTPQADTPAAVLEEVPGPSAGEKYQIVRQALTWDEARLWCESRGGHLATVTSREEEREILELLDSASMSAAWLGANNLNPANGFSWITGEEFTYASWGPGEPNNTNGTEYYLMLNLKQDAGWVWNDSRNDGLSLFETVKSGFVCEWEDGER